LSAKIASRDLGGRAPVLGGANDRDGVWLLVYIKFKAKVIKILSTRKNNTQTNQQSLLKFFLSLFSFVTFLFSLSFL